MHAALAPRSTLVVISALVSTLGDESRARDLERGVALFRAGDFTGAILPLERAYRADPADLDTALLLGITYQRAGRPEEARPLLEAAAASSDAEIASSAHLFLGLMARGEGRDEEARARFAEVAAGGVPDLAAAARRLAARDAPLSLYASLRTEVDDNVPLLPAASGAADGAAEGDVDVVGLVSVEGCLGEAHRACLGALFLGRKQARLDDHDLVALTAAARYRLERRALRLGLSYAFEPSWRGGAAFARAHVIDGSLKLAVAGDVWVTLAARFAHRTWLTDDYAPLSGPMVDGAAGLRWRDGRLDVQLAALGLREQTDDPTLAATGAGGRLDGRVTLFGPLSFELGARALPRWYDEGQRDVELAADGTLVLAVHDEIGLLLGGSALLRGDVHKLTAFLGVDVALAGP